MNPTESFAVDIEGKSVKVPNSKSDPNSKNFMFGAYDGKFRTGWVVVSQEFGLTVVLSTYMGKHSNGRDEVKWVMLVREN